MCSQWQKRLPGNLVLPAGFYKELPFWFIKEPLNLDPYPSVSQRACVDDDPLRVTDVLRVV
jgi:hypothetical protein